jgi:hypothetical protein
MPLPPRRYFFLPDVARRWGTTALDLATYAHEGLLELCVMTAATQVRFGWIDGEPEDCGHVPGGTRVLSGPQPLRSADLWPIIANRVGTIDHFKAPETNGYVALLEDAEPIRVTLHQLLVTREERDRFEQEYGLAPVDDPPPKANGAFAHAANYSDVTLLGRRHVLGPLQASIVRELHAASLRGEDWMSHQELLRACGAKSTRIVDSSSPSLTGGS